MARLRRYSWPGNIRELKHAVELAVLLSADGSTLRPEDFSLGDLRQGEASIRAIEENIERESLIAALIDNNFNSSAAAQSLKISRRTLYNRMKKHSLLERGGSMKRPFGALIFAVAMPALSGGVARRIATPIRPSDSCLRAR